MVSAHHATVLLLALTCVTGGVRASAGSGWRMPEEAEPQVRTWMAMANSVDIWGSQLLKDVQADQCLIASTLAQYQNVTMLVAAKDMSRAQSLCDAKVELVQASFDDLWMRDTGPVFVLKPDRSLGAVNFNFNGWGNKQTHQLDKKVAPFVAKAAGAELISSSLVLEGGGIEVDGDGTAIITESCVLNTNRNPATVTKATVEAELERVLGVTKVIWLPGLRGKDITDGHTDFYARFVRPGVVAAGLEMDSSLDDYDVTRTQLAMLQNATDARGRKLNITVMKSPTKFRVSGDDLKQFAGGYIGFYVANHAVLCQQFGDAAADAAAKSQLEALFPSRTVHMLNTDALSIGGGSIHCSTQQQPASSANCCPPTAPMDSGAAHGGHPDVKLAALAIAAMASVMASAWGM